MKHDPLLMVRSDLLRQIEGLQRDCSGLSLKQLCAGVDHIRAVASRHGFDAIERLASLLSSVVVYNGHRQIALTYLSLMHDAAEDGCLDAQGSEVFLAAAALRGCRPHH